MFDLNLFHIFHAVFSTSSVSHAADRLSMTPSAVSQALNRLRKEMDDPLFIRDGRGIKPTTKAIELHRITIAPFNVLLSSTENSHQFIKNESLRTFRISSHNDINIMFLPSLLQILKSEAPGIEITTDTSHNIEENRYNDLRHRKVDLILSTIAPSDPSFNYCLLLKEPLVLALNKFHPRLSNSVTITEFFKEEHILWLTKRHNLSTLDSLSNEDLLPMRKIAYQSNSIVASLHLAANSDWLCVSSKWHANRIKELGIINVVPIPFETKPIPLYACWHHSKNNDQGLQWIISKIKQLVTEKK
ncbi:LysR family transcriptional regulator [Aliivibrio fischeri]|uniref:LysR family transcriptional regulator n=1 Tax=Aliivibrio fischeri TaxID=668 RepID=UPI0007C436D4|nr:LysR family transcriptional regulator [Aliivibrio fischeri]MUK92718.1 LysR family transcriptional regulator [Aliivibrio fischeri]